MKKLQRLVTIKLKNVNITAIKSYFQRNQKLISYLYLTKFLLLRKTFKYLTGYINDDYKIKPFSKILPKMSPYIERYDGQIKWMYLLIEHNDLGQTLNYAGFPSPDRVFKKRAGQKMFLILIPEKIFF